MILYICNTYLRSDTSLPIKLMMLEVKMKLEKTVKRPAIPGNIHVNNTFKIFQNMYICL